MRTPSPQDYAVRGALVLRQVQKYLLLVQKHQNTYVRYWYKSTKYLLQAAACGRARAHLACELC